MRAETNLETRQLLLDRIPVLSRDHHRKIIWATLQGLLSRASLAAGGHDQLWLFRL